MCRGVRAEMQYFSVSISVAAYGVDVSEVVWAGGERMAFRFE